MSLMDEANSIRDRIRERLQELTPLVEEYRELLAVAHEMGLETDVTVEVPVAPTSPPLPAPTVETSSAPRRSPERATRPARAASRSRRPGSADLGARVLAAVSREPGGTVADYADRLGVTAAVLYRPVRDLTSDGRLVKRGRQLLVP